jgi:hypothetical protein
MLGERNPIDLLEKHVRLRDCVAVLVKCRAHVEPAVQLFQGIEARLHRRRTRAVLSAFVCGRLVLRTVTVTVTVLEDVAHEATRNDVMTAIATTSLAIGLS